MTTADSRSDLQPQVLQPRWYTVPQVAILLGYSISKTKALVLKGQIRSVKDGGSRRVLPEWVDEYIARRVSEAGK